MLKDTCMRRYDKKFLIQLKNYGLLYYLVGVVEITLRRKMIITLSSFAIERNRGEWFSVIPDDQQFNNFLLRAIAHNKGKVEGVELHLPFLFWRNLFSNRNYTDFWTPMAHLVFAGLVDPKSRKSYEEVQDHIFIIHGIRNRVAHYDFEGSQPFEEEKEDLLWFIEALGK